MAIKCTESQRSLCAEISGELDHHHARQVIHELECQIDAALPQWLILDFTSLSFTDSSGIAVLIRAFRRMEQLGGTLMVRNTPEQARKVFFAAGLQRMIQFE